MTFSTGQAAYLYVGAIVDELARAGVQHACLCPGSRSAPLALLLAKHPQIKLWRHLDERSAGFFALGMAKASRRPVVLLCTSGTAAANFLPAIVEAHYARVPLLVFTADRPPELRDTGAPQTIDQLKLYGSFAKWFVEMALPEVTPEMMRYARSVACRAVALAAADPAGVVHLNFPFREPLVPVPVEPPITDEAREAYVGRTDGRPYATVVPALRQADPQLIGTLADELSKIERGLIIAGPQTDPDFPAAVARLSAALGYPLLADPLSLVRCGPHTLDNVIDCYDAFLRDPAAVERLIPEVILRFGAMPTSKPVLLYLQRYPHTRQILVDGGGGWPDTARLASDVIHADATLFCESLSGAVRRAEFGRPPLTDWLSVWQSVNSYTRQAITTQLAAFETSFEGRVFTELAECLPEETTCYVSSSMPVRDLDTFFPSLGRSIRFLSNRGANGIDGVVSSALGAGAVSPGPLVLVIGDLAFYHDLNGLLAARLHQLRATIVLINNDGGGIFSFLPQAAHPDHFEQLFGAPHGLDFRPAAEMYGAAFHRPEAWDEFRGAVKDGLVSNGLTIVEVRTNRESNVTMHRQVWRAAAHRLARPVSTD
jgi:2-succinyl-5-enolpyruvyl-6-hydroxy-3-cyclohexene-1-carboxylate synthase